MIIVLHIIYFVQSAYPWGYQYFLEDVGAGLESTVYCMEKIFI